MPTETPTPQPVAAATDTETVVSYAVEEYLPFDERWVVVYGGIETPEEGVSRRDAIAAKAAEAGETQSRFRVTESTAVTTVRIVG